MFFGKLRKSPFPSLEKYLENQSKISVFYGYLGTWYEHFAVGLGQPILVSSFLRVIPRGVCWKIPSKFITLHAKKLRKQSKIIDFYGTLGTWYEPFSVSLGQPNLVSSFFRTISRGICQKVSKKSLPSLEKYLEKLKKFEIFTVHLEHDMNTWQSAWGNQILRQAFLEQSLEVFVGKFQKIPFPTLEKYFEKQSKICDFYCALGTWYEHFAVGLGQQNFRFVVFQFSFLFPFLKKNIT